MSPSTSGSTSRRSGSTAAARRTSTPSIRTRSRPRCRSSEGGAVEVDEIVAVTMGPESAVRALHKAVSLGADRSVHLTDAALAGSDVAATGYALAKVLETEGPISSCSASSLTTASATRSAPSWPSICNAVADAGDRDGRRRRQLRLRAPGRVRLRHRGGRAPGRDPVGDAINEPRYPSLKAIMGAKKKPLDTQGRRRRRHRRRPGRRGRLQVACGDFKAPPQKRRQHHRGQGHQRDGREDRRLARREEADLRQGSYVTPSTTRAIQQELARRRLGGREACRRARQRGRCARRRRGSPTTRGVARQVRREQGLSRRGARGPRPAGRRRHGPAVRPTTAIDYALFGGGLLGFEIGAGLAARLNAGVTMEVTAVNVRTASSSPSARSSGTRRSRRRLHRRAGIIIGRLNAFESPRRRRRGRGRRRRRRALRVATKAKMVQRGEQRGADVNIEDADILVAGGRGLGEAEGFELCEDARRALGGAVRRPVRSSTPAGTPTPVRSARPARRSRRSCTSQPASRARSSTRSGCRAPRTSSRSTRTRTRRSSSSRDLGIVGDLNKILPKLTEAVKAKKGG